MKKIFILPLLLSSSAMNGAVFNKQILLATTSELTFYEVLLISALFVMCIILLVVTITLQNFVKVLLKPKEQEDSAYTQAMESRTFWQKFWSLKPLSMEKDMMIEHEFDGISELDNPTPPWFMYLFYSSIVFAVVYLFAFHIVGNGQIMTNEYSEEIAIADKAHELYMKKFANSVNENNVKVLTDAKSLEDGSKIYTQNCVACHGDKGQGIVGPNLTDEFWLHGGSTKDIFHTITEGVPEKGMISWKKSLNPIQVQHVVSYISTLQGTKPANPKEPQGDKYVAK
ncbi:cbb3-type cytochrome c oxidase N-terminal domain-containing protein [Arcicella sp. LKC2W]|uniref:cbb3-type cytochrome c oxidase N-terminal domain-containing protein n=1 Tax=Arcicella sp. LKC2W TaxID=2984198 RepID=UPI002B204A24|nr:cbb3-type cytochrome c oxidase N-terminal domain-containing protein [Arcicella sp. LKC2W]MEA5459029.1 cbb3-type cytochrome c oxidase N-terminal domain-containing protein [Arcicella sp. LKC2W]